MPPFDPILESIVRRGYHDHRSNSHSNLLTERIVADIEARCDAFAEDRRRGLFQQWTNVPGPDRRNTDLLIGAADANGNPDLRNVRILMEHKSVATAHRNRDARYQDIEREMLATYDKNPRTIVVATLIVGVSPRVLNIPDCVKKHNQERFRRDILPRLSRGDATLWDEFRECVSTNEPDDPEKTVAKFRQLPIREPADTHETGLDFMLFIPMRIDNVNPPEVTRLGGIDPYAAYDEMIGRICRTYSIRWYGR